MSESRYYATVPLLEEPEITAKDFRIWAIFCSFHTWRWEQGKPVASKRGSCFPSVEAVAERAHCSISSVFRTIKKLEATGHLVREHCFREDGGQTANNYTLKA